MTTRIERLLSALEYEHDRRVPEHEVTIDPTCPTCVLLNVDAPGYQDDLDGEDDEPWNLPEDLRTATNERDLVGLLLREMWVEAADAVIVSDNQSTGATE
jgi:hypothetical protein